MKEGFDITKIDKHTEKHLIQLNTSTPRTVTLELNMDAKTLRLWINGFLKDKRTVVVPEGTWSPIVEIQEQGNIVAINPALGKHRVPIAISPLAPLVA